MEVQYLIYLLPQMFLVYLLTVQYLTINIAETNVESINYEQNINIGLICCCKTKS